MSCINELKWEVIVWLWLDRSYEIRRGSADWFAKLRFLQQNAADFSAAAQTVANPALSDYSGEHCGPAFAAVGSFSSRSSDQGRLLSLSALTQMHQQGREKELDRIPRLLFSLALGRFETQICVTTILWPVQTEN